MDAVEPDDGFTVYPGRPASTRFATDDDHRVVMRSSMLGLRARAARSPTAGASP